MTFKGEEAVFCECCASLSEALKTGAKSKLYKDLKGGELLLPTCVTVGVHVATLDSHPEDSVRCWTGSAAVVDIHSHSLLIGEEKSSMFTEVVVEYIRTQWEMYTNRFGVTGRIRKHFSGAVN